MLLKKLISNPKTPLCVVFISLIVGVPISSYAAPAIVAGNVNVREGASVRYKKIGTLRPGWQVDAGPCQAGWCHVRVGRLYGWASARYLNFSYGGHVARSAPYYNRQPSIIIESGPVIRRQPYWGWNSWNRGYRPAPHHYRPKPLPPQPAPPVPFYDPYRVSPFMGPGPVYPPMHHVPIGEGVRPAGR